VRTRGDCHGLEGWFGWEAARGEKLDFLAVFGMGWEAAGQVQGLPTRGVCGKMHNVDKNSLYGTIILLSCVF